MTNAELAVLSLIAEQPRHGYEIEQVIKERGMRDWTEVGFSSIYYLLKKLEQNGLIDGRTAQVEGRGPARKVYHMTSAGKNEWREATLEALSTPRRCYTPFQLGLANLPGISTEEALTALREYHDRMVERRDYVRSRAENQRPLPYHVEAMFDLSITLMEAELNWISRFISQLEEREEN